MVRISQEICSDILPDLEVELSLPGVNYLLNFSSSQG